MEFHLLQSDFDWGSGAFPNCLGAMVWWKPSCHFIGGPTQREKITKQKTNLTSI